MRRAALVLFASSLSASCAFVVHGRSRVVTVVSDPSGARIFIDNEQVGVTPAQLSLLRSRTDLVLRIEKDGCAPATVRLKRSVSGWIAGDVAMTARMATIAGQGLDSLSDLPKAVGSVAALSFGLDFATGAAYNLSPSRVLVRLKPVQVQPR